MKRTERQLWQTFYRALDRRLLRGGAWRFEVLTQTGVSDVEYVLCGWHGWIELKVSTTRDEDAPLRFGSPFTVEQCTWLLAHHDPRRFLRSWLLIGFGAGARWRQLLLVPAPDSILLLRPATTLRMLRERSARAYSDMSLVIRCLVSSTTEEEG